MTGGEEGSSDDSINNCYYQADSVSTTYFDYTSLVGDVRNDEVSHLPLSFATNRAELISPSSLSEEERRLLVLEGVTLSNNLPLTEDEERALKVVRRKIRNKVSAKTSRKRKRVYIDNLEKRVRHSSIQNHSLMERVSHLERQNSSLMEELVRLRSGMTLPTFASSESGCVANTAVPSSAPRRKFGLTPYNMVLLMSFALLMMFNIDPLDNWNQLPGRESTGRAFNSFEQSGVLFSVHPSPGLQEPDQCPVIHPFLPYCFQTNFNHNHRLRSARNRVSLQQTELFSLSPNSHGNTSEFLTCHIMRQDGEAEGYSNEHFLRF